MQIVDILVLATVALVLLGGLVALGLGHRRWSIGTVVAGFLVLLSAATFLYLAARIAQRDRAWKQKIDDLEARLAKAEHDRTPDPRSAGWEEGPNSLARLRDRRDRWRRGLDRIDTWRGRIWQNASFQPPKDDTSTGTVALAEQTNTADSPPLHAGSLVFLFDSIPFEEGGAYIGEFRIEKTGFDEATKRHILTVVQTAPRDEYDAKVLALPHDSVIVFEDLPVDRWLAFYSSPELAADDERGVLPEAVKDDAGKVRELLESSTEVKQLVQRFVETFEQHEQDVPKDEWERAEQQAAEEPGTLWAEVTFTKPFSLGGGDARPAPKAEAAVPDAESDAAAEAAGSEGPTEPQYAPGDRATFDLQTAVELRDRDDVATIERVFRRRPLTDAMMILHGGASADGVATTGTPALVRLIRAEIAALERSNEQLRTARKAAVANTEDERKVAGELERDLASWRRDVGAAGDLAAALQRELDRIRRALRDAEAAIVSQGRELTTAIDRVAREIDLVAPPPERRAARP